MSECVRHLEEGPGRARSGARFGQRFITPALVTDALGVDADSASKRLSRWAADGWVRRVRRGMYIGVPVDAANPAVWSEDALIVATAVWAPCYFTGWTSANHWALTDQVFRTTVLKTTTRVRSSNVSLLDHAYLVAHASEAALSWGTKTEWHDGTRLRFADPARTVIDALDDPRLAGGSATPLRSPMPTSMSMIPSPSSTTATASGPSCLQAPRLHRRSTGRDRPDLITASQARSLPASLPSIRKDPKAVDG